MKKQYLRIKKDLLKIISDNLLNKANIAHKNSHKSYKNLNKTVDLILVRCAKAHKKDHIFNQGDCNGQDSIIQFIFKQPIKCIKDFVQAVFGNIFITIGKFQNHDISFGCFAKQSVKALMQIIIVGAMLVLMMIFALQSSSPIINILMIILALGFISRHYSHN